MQCSRPLAGHLGVRSMGEGAGWAVNQGHRGRGGCPSQPSEPHGLCIQGMRRGPHALWLLVGFGVLVDWRRGKPGGPFLLFPTGL